MSKTIRHRRQTKTPRQRAEEALGIAQRLVERLSAQQERLEAELQGVSAELKVALRRRDHLAQSPDLEDDGQMTLDDATVDERLTTTGGQA